MKRVSIIIPVYNNEEHIVECLESVVKQTYENIEIIICDDKSTDSSWEIIKNYIDNKNRGIDIKLIQNEENNFAGFTRNRCFSIATGDYIILQDADDYSASNRVEKLVDFLNNNPEYDIVGSGINLFDDDGIYKKSTPIARPIKDDFLFGIPFAHASLMFRKEALLKVGGYRISKSTRRGEDYDILMRMYARGCKGYNLNCHLYNYRVDSDTISRRKYKYRIDEAIVRYKGFKELDLMPKGYLYVVKPLIVGLIPQLFLNRLQNLRNRYKKVGH